MTPARFPVLFGGDRKELVALGCPQSVPWAFLAPHEPQAVVNHDQTLAHLAGRGGLGPDEMVAIVEGKTQRDIRGLMYPEAVPLLLAHLAAWEANEYNRLSQRVVVLEALVREVVENNGPLYQDLLAKQWFDRAKAALEGSSRA